MWLFRLFGDGNSILHISHVLFIPWPIFRWYWSPRLSTNSWEQMSHLWSLMPWWIVLTWRFKFACWENVFSHWGHLSLFFSWTDVKWVYNVLWKLNSFLQCSHLNSLVFSCMPLRWFSKTFFAPKLLGSFDQ